MARRPSGFRIDDPASVLVQALISYWGVTTANGGAGGATLVCADLVNQPEFDGNQVVIISGPYGGQARDINGTTLLGTVTPASNFGGVITANIIFAILPIRTVPAEVAALQATCNAILALVDVLDLTTFDQETAAGVAANGVTDVTLFDGTGITKPTKICGFMCTMAGVAWAGHPVVWIEDGDGNKIFPFQANYVEGTDFADGAQVVFNFPVVVPVAAGYNVMFRSTAAGDNAGQTLTLDNLDVIEVG